MAVKVITAPSAEPITLAQVKMNLRIVLDDEDDDIERMIVTARQMAEGRLNRALMPQVLEFAADQFCAQIKVPRPPLRALTSVKYIDSDGVEQTLDPAGYLLDDYVDPPTIAAAYGSPWPATRARGAAVKVRYDAGYADAASIPAPIIQWMHLAIGSMYENREAFINGSISQQLAGDFFQQLIQPYMVYE